MHAQLKLNRAMHHQQSCSSASAWPCGAKLQLTQSDTCPVWHSLSTRIDADMLADVAGAKNALMSIWICAVTTSSICTALCSGLFERSQNPYYQVWLQRQQLC